MVPQIMPFPRKPANDDHPDPLPPTSKAMIAMQVLEKLYVRQSEQPFREQGEPAMKRARKGCPHQCDDCYLSCAIISDRIAWWEDELSAVTGSIKIGRA